MGVELQVDGLWAWCLRSAMKAPTTTNEIGGGVVGTRPKLRYYAQSTEERH